MRLFLVIFIIIFYSLVFIKKYILGIHCILYLVIHDCCFHLRDKNHEMIQKSKKTTNRYLGTVLEFLLVGIQLSIHGYYLLYLKQIGLFVDEGSVMGTGGSGKLFLLSIALNIMYYSLCATLLQYSLLFLALNLITLFQRIMVHFLR